MVPKKPRACKNARQIPPVGLPVLLLKQLHNVDCIYVHLTVSIFLQSCLTCHFNLFQ